MPSPRPAARLLNSDDDGAPPRGPPAVPHAPRNSRVRSRQDDDGRGGGRSIVAVGPSERAAGDGRAAWKAARG